MPIFAGKATWRGETNTWESLSVPGKRGRGKPTKRLKDCKERPGVGGLKEAAMKDQGTVTLRPLKEYSSLNLTSPFVCPTPIQFFYFMLLL